MGDETFADFFRPSQTSSVANVLMEEWEEEVAALKLSKKQKWKGSMRNQSGVIALVKYVPDGVRVDSVTTHFVHKLNAQRKGGRGTELAWIPVLSRSQQAARAAALVNEAEEKSEKKLFIFTTPPGAVPVYADEMDAHIQAASSEPIGVFANEAVRGNDERICELIREHIEAAATGNHSPRRHPIHVPRAPGEPVRG